MPRLLDDEKRVLAAIVAQLNRIEVKLNAIQALLSVDHTLPVEADAAAAKLEFPPPSSSPSATPPPPRS